MRKIMVMFLLVAGLTVWGVKTAGAAEIITEDMILKEVLTKIDFVKNADNFIILFSSAASMKAELPGTGKSQLEVAKQILKERNKLLPDLGFNAGLYVYSHPYRVLYPVQPYDRARFGKAIDQLPDEAKGLTDLKEGLHQMRKVIGGLKGKTVVFVLTDGSIDPFRYVGKSPKTIAREIAAKNNVSFYVISTAKGETEKELVKAVASINASSRVIPLEAFTNRSGYMSGALFDILETSIVKLRLVEKAVGFIMDDIQFDFNRADIKAEYLDELEKLGKFLQENPSTFVVMDGYTDSIGTEEANLWLSRRRVMNVADYLVEQFNIEPLRIVPMWYGELNPATDNGTEQGRALNRRVESTLGGL